jgi:hypothetical protein
VIKSKTHVGHIQPIFRYADGTEKKMRVQIARIAVLYDDPMLKDSNWTRNAQLRGLRL